MMEVGPWRMDGMGGFQTQEGGWEEYMTVVYGESSVLFWYSASVCSSSYSGSACGYRVLVG